MVQYACAWHGEPISFIPMGLYGGRMAWAAALQQHVVNPIVRLAWSLKLPIPGDALLETTGRRSRLPRHTPICDGLDGDSFWIVAQRGRASDWVRNLEADPRVRVKVRGGPHARWRTGTAHILDQDDPDARRRLLARTSLARRLCLSTAALSTEAGLTIRIDLDAG